MPYFDDCCKLLATDAEYASDQHLLHIVQLQRLSERITFISSQNILGTHGPGSSSERSFREMKLELEQYRASLPCPLNENSKPTDYEKPIDADDPQISFTCNTILLNCISARSACSIINPVHKARGVKSHFKLRPYVWVSLRPKRYSITMSASRCAAKWRLTTPYGFRSASR